jgi:hypothetical protein
MSNDKESAVNATVSVVLMLQLFRVAKAAEAEE